MSFNDFYQRFTAFGISLTLGLFASAFFYGISFSGIFTKESKPAPKIVASTDEGGGNGASSGCLGPDAERFEDQTSKKSKSKPETVKSVEVISKPPPDYTDAARTNAVQGKVVLRVTFKADSTIGAISVVSGLPDGLTETAKEAAKGIKFKPATRGGVPYSVTKPVEYTFTIY